jgi:phage shock protein A
VNPASDQALLEELRRHRAELRDSMSALEDALAAPVTGDRQRWSLRVHAALLELSGDFREHVDLTEGDNGLYRELLATAPRLAEAVTGLTREHGLVRDQVEKLLGRVTASDVTDPERVRNLGTLLLGRLVRHRQRGSDLVFEAYEFDIGGET